MYTDLGPTDNGVVAGYRLGDERSTAEELLDLLATRPVWWADALCRGEHEGVDWFPERGEAAGPAKAVCERCTVREACLAFAMAEGIDDGIWGGLSRLERRALRRATRKTRAGP